MGDFFNNKVFKLITPFRVIAIVYFIKSILEYLKVSTDDKDGQQGLVVLIYLIVFVFSILLDAIFSYFLKQKNNWIVQLLGLIIMLFIFYVL